MNLLIRYSLVSALIVAGGAACKSTGRNGADPKVIGGSRVASAQPYIV